MEMPVEKVFKSLVKRFKKDPENWMTLSEEDKKGYINQAVLHYEEMWVLKYPLGPQGSPLTGFYINDVDKQEAQRIMKEGEPFVYDMLVGIRKRLYCLSGIGVHYPEKGTRFGGLIPRQVDEKATEELEDLMRKRWGAEFFDRYA